MNTSLKYIVIASFMLSLTASFAQLKNQKTESVKIYGNCGMCKSTIEKAGIIKNQSNVDWDKETKMATISYDSSKTSKEEILKRIALAGYDSDTFLAPDDTYSSLPSCCQYERAVQTIAKTEETKMDMATDNHTTHSNKMTEMQESNSLTPVFDNYFAIKDALVKTDGVSASANAKTLLNTINDVNMNSLSMDVHMAWMKVLETLKEDAQHIADTKDVSLQRKHFSTLSNNIYELMKDSKQETPTYYQLCPMANNGKGANWLSKESTIKNPYYGSQMLSCGKTVEIIEKTDGKIEETNQPVEKKSLSPHTNTMAMIGGAHIHIDYSSPGVRNRIIFGGLLAYDTVWQSGAHKATWIETNKDLVIDGKILPAGKYGFFTIPSKDEWTIIFNSNWDQHGKDDFNENDNVLSFKVKPIISDTITEHLEYKITQVNDANGSISLTWEKVSINFNFQVNQ